MMTHVAIQTNRQYMLLYERANLFHLSLD